MPVVQLDHVRKEFVVYRRSGRLRRERLRVVAVEDISLTIEPGELVGYIGPNGAGKSTTIKMLTGILAPTSGTVKVADVDPQRHRTQLTRQIGAVFGQRSQLWWDLPLRDSFDLLRHVYRVPAHRHAENRNTFIELLELGPLLDKPVRQLSLGERMRGELTAALLHDPVIVYLDEPTIGLDIASKTRVREFLATVNREREMTIILTTHDLDDVARLCSRIVVIDHGCIIQDSTLEDVRRRFAHHRTLVVDLAETSPPLTVPGAEVVKIDGPRQWLRFRRDEHTAADLIARIAATTSLLDVSVVEPDIEEVIGHVYGTT